MVLTALGHGHDRGISLQEKVQTAAHQTSQILGCLCAILDLRPILRAMYSTSSTVATRQGMATIANAFFDRRNCAQEVKSARAGGRTRTDDLTITNRLRFQLRHTGL